MNAWELIPAACFAFLGLAVVASFVIVWMEDRDPKPGRKPKARPEIEVSRQGDDWTWHAWVPIWTFHGGKTRTMAGAIVRARWTAWRLSR